VKKRSCNTVVVMAMVLVIMIMTTGCGNKVKGPADYVLSDRWVCSVLDTYKENPANYPLRYNDKIIEVSGQIKSILHNGSSTPGQFIVMIKDEDCFVLCMVDSDTDNLGRYNEGDQTTIHGYYRASNTLNQDYQWFGTCMVGPILLHCQFITN